MLSTLLTWLTNTGASAIGDQILRYQELKFRAENNEQAREHEETIQRLEKQQELLLAESNYKLTSWIRPALALPVVIYWVKLIIWDTLLKLGSTPYPGDHVVWFVTLIPAAYFLVRPFEKR